MSQNVARTEREPAAKNARDRPRKSETALSVRDLQLAMHIHNPETISPYYYR
jgi:hypothetical protein